MSEENRNELKKELKNISTLYHLENSAEAGTDSSAHKLPSEKTLQDELNDISLLYQL